MNNRESEKGLTEGHSETNLPKSNISKWWKEKNQDFYQGWTKVASGSGGVALVFGWALAEATVWPVIPDFVLAPLEAASRQKSYRLLLASASGSAIGSVLLFALTRRNPAKMRSILTKLPLVHGYHVEQIEKKLAQNWRKTLIMQPWSGVPAKIVVAVGAEKSLLTWQALPVLMLSRTLRMVVVFAVARLFGKILKRPLNKASLVVFFFYLLFFFPVWWQIVKDRSKNTRNIV